MRVTSRLRGVPIFVYPNPDPALRATFSRREKEVRSLFFTGLVLLC